MGFGCFKMIDVNFIKPLLFANELYTLAQISQGSIKMIFINFIKLDKIFKSGSKWDDLYLMRVCCCHTQPSPLPSRLFNVKVGHWDHLAVLLQSPLGGAKRSQTRTPQGEGRNRRPRRKDDRPLHRPLLRLLCRCCLLDCIALHHKNEGVGSSETSPNLINLGTFYEAQSDFSMW